MGLGAMIGLGMLCGIGFTMSLFIGSLAFNKAPLLYTESVIGVLMASVASALLGLAWLRAVLRKPARA
jgi:NhaA family Na+:H+ antiporter